MFYWHFGRKTENSHTDALYVICVCAHRASCQSSEFPLNSQQNIFVSQWIQWVVTEEEDGGRRKKMRKTRLHSINQWPGCNLCDLIVVAWPRTIDIIEFITSFTYVHWSDRQNENEGNKKIQLPNKMTRDAKRKMWQICKKKLLLRRKCNCTTINNWHEWRIRILWTWKHYFNTWILTFILDDLIRRD